MSDYEKLTVTVSVPDTDRAKELQLHVLENYRDNWLDEGIFDERSSASGFGQLEYTRMIETLASNDILTKEGVHPSLSIPSRRLSRLGRAYLEFLEQQIMPQVVVSVAPFPPQETQVVQLSAVEPARSIHAVGAATSRPWWRNFWRKDVVVITGIVGTTALVAMAAIQCGAF